MLIDDATRLVGHDIKELALHERFKSENDHNRTFVATRSVGRIAQERSLMTGASSMQQSVAPYAMPNALAGNQLVWRTQLTQRWLHWHLGLSLLALAGAVMLIANPAMQLAGVFLLTYTCAAVALIAFALIFARYQAPTGAAVLALGADVLAVLLGIALLGPRLETLVLLPGTLLITALLVDQWIVIMGACIGFGAFAVSLALSQFGMLHAALTIDEYTFRWLDMGFLFIGLVVLLVAINLVLQQLRSALANEAAMTHRLVVADRRSQAKRIAIDADAVALQTQLARTLRGMEAQPVTTCEELAPLANMINATTARLPALLHDREERLRLEKAIRDLASTLESAWAGFELRWPAQTGTTVDRLVTILRPSHGQTLR